MSRGTSSGTKAMAVAFLGVVLGLVTVVTLIVTGTITPPADPAPVVTDTTPEPAAPAEIYIDEDATDVPNVTPPDHLNVIMRPEDRDGKDPLTRCLDMGGDELRTDNVCMHVDY